ncbi:cytidylate kinase [Nitratireductor aquibiodomus RA22]|uniref:Cytidylate kinase n=2 Tax=Nitratireductor aquibiodomus TaxID=204799 RepID=I5BZ19_9HYPH|nr:cytidylate kinase [Nitratireductor aquibiodomus RA22]
MTGMSGKLTIAIDGPAASGKGTLARRLAAHYGLRHLDTGLTYRGVARALIEAGQPLDDEAIAERAARALDLGALDRGVLSEHGIGEAASKVAVMPNVRRALVDKQRAFASAPPGAVLDGRDIGTVVCPDADVKLYVIASAEVRATRRWREIEAGGGSAAYTEILADIERRDARDMGRADSPLRPADDAHLLDTSEMDIETAFLAACRLVDATRISGNED